MTTIILAGLIFLSFLLAVRSLIKDKGACTDCSCDCPIKEEMN